ncbi:MAG: 2-dehydropantoate 2-reductase [Methanothrix sp.]|nr:2-dehydropantoate 2-reductase [Methanothrix sp.]MDD4447395.1 2-dehydropantoate 2-reductase [Methanothrix sp.]
MADILIYGAGAIGSFMGYLLSDPGKSSDGKIENVALLGRKSHINRITDMGLKIRLPEKRKLLQFKYCFADLADLKASDFFPEIVIICVKTYSLSAVCDELRKSGLLQERLGNAIFILLMNGMGNREAFDELHLSDSQVLEGITSLGVKFSEGGMVELKGKGKTIIEERMREDLKKFMAARFQEKGFEIEFAPDFKDHQYSKLFANAVINPITALTRRENGIVLSSLLKSTVQGVVREAVAVAAMEGIRREEKSVRKMVYSVAEKTSGNTSSMLQDLLKGRITEIDSINGYIIRQARKHKIEVPVNEALYELVKSATSADQPNININKI